MRFLDHAAAGQFQITTSRDSMLVDWSSKDSIVMKAAQKDEQTRTNGWKSAAFDSAFFAHLFRCELVLIPPLRSPRQR